FQREIGVGRCSRQRELVSAIPAAIELLETEIPALRTFHSGQVLARRRLKPASLMKLRPRLVRRSLVCPRPVRVSHLDRNRGLIPHESSRSQSLADTRIRTERFTGQKCRWLRARRRRSGWAPTTTPATGAAVRP